MEQHVTIGRHSRLWQPTLEVQQRLLEGLCDVQRITIYGLSLYKAQMFLRFKSVGVTTVLGLCILLLGWVNPKLPIIFFNWKSMNVGTPFSKSEEHKNKWHFISDVSEYQWCSFIIIYFFNLLGYSMSLLPSESVITNMSSIVSETNSFKRPATIYQFDLTNCSRYMPLLSSS